MNRTRRFSFLVGVIIGVAIAILEFRGIASLADEGREWLRRQVGRDGRNPVE